MIGKSIGIYYFSGTGNTKIVAELLMKAFEDRGSKVEITRIEDVMKGKNQVEIDNYDIIGIGYPVHAFNAPRIVFKFIKELPAGDKKVFIFKSSADPLLNGGPTTLVRSRLQQKRYSVVYEKLVVMPANVLVKYDDELMKQLYTTAVSKAPGIVDDILAGKVSLQKSNILTQIGAYFFSGLEWVGAPFFGKDLTVDESCDLCGVCVENCPTSNITLDDTITFGWDCIMCLRCIYNCPVQAIRPRLYRFFVLKDGYNIQEIIDDPHIKGEYITSSTKGYFKRFYQYMMG